MKWLRHVFSQRTAVDDPTFALMTREQAIWTSLPNDHRGFMVNIVAGNEGPSDGQRLLYGQITDNLDSITREAKRYLKSNAEFADNQDSSDLAVYALVIGDDAETECSQFTLELSDANPLAADLIHGVWFDNFVPARYYQDHQLARGMRKPLHY